MKIKFDPSIVLASLQSRRAVRGLRSARRVIRARAFTVSRPAEANTVQIVTGGLHPGLCC